MTNVRFSITGRITGGFFLMGANANTLNEIQIYHLIANAPTTHGNQNGNTKQRETQIATALSNPISDSISLQLPSAWVIRTFGRQIEL